MPPPDAESEPPGGAPAPPRDAPLLPEPEGPQREERRALATIFGGVFLLLSFNAVRERWPRPVPFVERAAERQLDYRVDLNAANEVELQHLPGIGPALAARIVADRRERGRFATIADLERVKGLGPKLVARLAPHVAAPAAGPRNP